MLRHPLTNLVRGWLVGCLRWRPSRESGVRADGTSLLILAAIIHLALIRPLRSSAGATERASERGFPFLQTGQTELLKEQHAFLLKASLLAPLPPLCVHSVGPLSKHISPIPYTSVVSSALDVHPLDDPFNLHPVEVARHNKC